MTLGPFRCESERTGRGTETSGTPSPSCSRSRSSSQVGRCAGRGRVRWLVRQLAEGGHTPLAHHARVVPCFKISAGDPLALQHEGLCSLCKILETMVCYDQVDVLNLAAADLVCRQLQLLEDRIRQSSGGHRWMREGIQALNEIGGDGRVPPPCANVAQRQVLTYVDSSYFAVGKPDASMDAAGAPSELCGSAILYDSSRSDLASYVKERISWTAPESLPMDMFERLPADLLWLRSWERRLLRTPAEPAKAKEELGINEPCMDTILKRDREQYAGLSLRLESAGMLGWRVARGRRGKLGAFFVYKKNCHDLRLVFDTRMLKCEFVGAPSSQLPSAGAFSMMEMPAGSTFFSASGDIKNCSCTIKMPPSLQERLFLPPVTAASVGKSGDGVAMDPGCMILPVPHGMVLGPSHRPGHYDRGDCQGPRTDAADLGQGARGCGV